MQQSLGRLVSILYRKNQVYLNHCLKEYQLTAAEVPVLMCLFHRGGLSQEQLSSYLEIDKAATARTVQSLVEKRYLRKEKDPDDRRINRIFLTERALHRQKPIQQILLRWTTFLTDGLDSASLATMFHALESMVDKLKDGYPDKAENILCEGGEDHASPKPAGN